MDKYFTPFIVPHPNRGFKPKELKEILPQHNQWLCVVPQLSRIHIDVKAIRGKKTDKKDAKWIADLFKHDLVSGSFMPPADIRQLRDLMRYRFKLTCFKSSEKNRLQNCLTVSNIQLGNVVSDTFGKSAQAILDKILENPADTSFDREPLVFKSLKKKLPELRDAIDGYITPEQAGKLKVIKSHSVSYTHLDVYKRQVL